jgi:hypothetical protein
MKKLIIILVLISAVGCATQKEALNKGYLQFDKNQAIVGGIIALATGTIDSDGTTWNIPLMKINYPECFEGRDELDSGLGIICVQEKVKEEGSWR